jgi:hypothetical protein
MPGYYSGLSKTNGEAEVKNRRLSFDDPFNPRLQADYF